MLKTGRWWFEGFLFHPYNFMADFIPLAIHLLLRIIMMRKTTLLPADVVFSLQICVTVATPPLCRFSLICFRRKIARWYICSRVTF